MDEIYYNQNILCKVKNCKFYKEEHCSLGQILVNNCHKGTQCASFKKND